METIAKEFGIKRYNWLVYMDKKAKEEEKRQKEIIKGDPAVRKLSRKERRKFSQIERGREREAARTTGRTVYHDPYRESRRSPSYESYYRSRRSRSRSHSPSRARRYERGDNNHHSRSKSKIEYITEFGGSNDVIDRKTEGISPPSSPLQADLHNRPSEGHILEALHIDPASSLPIEYDKSSKLLKPSMISASSSSSAIAKLSKTANGAPLKASQGEKKETPQERLKRIMSKQLNKQIKKDTAAEIAKKREQERRRQEKLAETSRLSRSRRYSRSRSHSRSRSPHRRYRHGRSRSGSGRSRSSSRSPRRYHSRSHSRSRSPRYRSSSRR